MATYVLAYKGGRMPETDAERDAQMAAWGGWFQNLGAAVVDAGNPFGPSKGVAGDGTISDGAPSALTGSPSPSGNVRSMTYRGMSSLGQCDDGRG